MTDWCILRCSGASTLRLAESLAGAGYAAWTPAEEMRKVVRGKVAWLPVPMLPTFVFADSAHLGGILELARSPALTYRAWDKNLLRFVSKGHPFFRLFHTGETTPLVPDHELAPLRRIEGRRKRKPRGAPKEWEVGDPVRLTEGAYEGLRGRIVGIKGKKVEVMIPGASFTFWLPAYAPIPDIDGKPSINVNTRSPEPLRTAA